jgi:hypothetical protein
MMETFAMLFLMLFAQQLTNLQNVSFKRLSKIGVRIFTSAEGWAGCVCVCAVGTSASSLTLISDLISLSDFFLVLLNLVNASS